jgi:hypothetical protein
MPKARTTQKAPTSNCIVITITPNREITLSAPTALPASSVCSYTVSRETSKPSAPLSEAAVRVGNSLLTARVPEDAFLRDTDEDF